MNGLYLFTLNVHSYVNINIDAVLTKDGEHIVTVFSGSEDSIHGVNSAIIECNMFESVWVECLSNGGSVDKTTRSSFSGLLLVEYV